MSDDNMIDVTGKGKWAKLFEHNRDMGSKKAEGAKYDYPEATSIEVYLDQEELSKVTKKVPSTKPKIDEEGIRVKFKRNWINRVPSRGGPPVVKDAEGNPWDSTVLIGDGSTVRIIAEVYTHQYGKSARLVAVQVLELVEYEPEEGEGAEVAIPF